MPRPSLHPQAEALLEQIAKANLPSWHTLPIGEARETFLSGVRAGAGVKPELAAIEDATLPGPAGPLPVRIYRPASEGILPGLLYFHGGGFALGGLDSHDTICRHLAKRSGTVVASVDYRLAPEHPFPAANDDARKAALWFHTEAEALGVDVERLAIGGDSAGATLALDACRAFAPAAQPYRFQLLIYPVADARMLSESYLTFADGYRLTQPVMAWFFELFLPNPERMRLDPRVSPVLAKDLGQLPPASIVTAGFDPLRDEGEALAKAINAQGGKAEYRCFDDMIHGFCNLPGVLDRGREALEFMSERLARALEA